MPDRKPFANSFLPPCSANVPRRMGNYPQTVSCRHAPPMPHAGQETIRKQFPAAMLLHCFMPDEKLSANSFLLPCSTNAPRRTGNYPRAVSCRYAPLLPHAGWETIREQFPSAMLHQWSQVGRETIREQFPVAMLHHCPTPDGKLFANSFLSLCSTTAPCQTGNYPPIVSCRHAPPLPLRRTRNYPPIVSCRLAPPLPHAEQETIREQFPVTMLHHCPMPDGKLSANSFLPPCSATAPRRMGNHRKKTVKK